MLKKFTIFISSSLLLLASFTTNASEVQKVTNGTMDFNQTKISDFIDYMSNKHKFSKNDLKKLFTKAKFQTSIIKSISKPHETLPWYKYKKIFITPNRIKEGIKFYQEHEAELKKAEEVYGVSPTMIVAIIGVETYYGKRKGGYLILDALSTLAFGYPPRAKFFQSELENFLLLAKEENMDPTSIKGSYAGAMGIPQFMPSSYRHYAMDFSNDGKRNLLTNDTDAIGSVANYFSKHHWKHNAPIAIHANKVPNNAKKLVNKKTKANSTITALKAANIEFQTAVNDLQKASLISLDEDKAQDYWIGLNNFYVITRYNVSINYAMVAFQLSEAIRAGLEIK